MLVRLYSHLWGNNIKDKHLSLARHTQWRVFGKCKLVLIGDNYPKLGWKVMGMNLVREGGRKWIWPKHIVWNPPRSIKRIRFCPFWRDHIYDDTIYNAQEVLQPIFISAHGSKSKNVVDTQQMCDLFMFTHPLFVNLSSLKCLLIIPESIFAKLWQLLRGVQNSNV